MFDRERSELVNWIKNHNRSKFMNDDYERVTKGYPHNELKESYDKDYLNKLINYFESLEDYEKCELLKLELTWRF